MNRRNRKRKQSSAWEELISSLKKTDIKQLLTDKCELWQRLPKFHQRALLILVPVLLILFVIPAPDPAAEAGPSLSEPARVEVSVNTTSLSEQQDVTPSTDIPSADDNQADSSVSQSTSKVTRNGSWKEYIVQRGDTLAKVFRANELSMSDLNALVNIEGLDKPLSKIQAGQLIRYKLTAQGDLDILQLEKSGASVMFFRLSDGGFGRSK